MNIEDYFIVQFLEWYINIAQGIRLSICTDCLLKKSNAMSLGGDYMPDLHERIEVTVPAQ